MNMILQYLNDSFANTSSSVNKEEMCLLLLTQDEKFNRIVKEVVTDIRGRLEANLRSFKYEVLEEKKVVSERHGLLEKELSILKESIELKIQGVYDLISSDVRRLVISSLGFREMLMV